MNLTPTEKQLYAAIVNADGAVMSPADLIREIGYHPVGNGSDSLLVRSHIHNLRAKVGAQEVGTRRGKGYYWANRRLEVAS